MSRLSGHGQHGSAAGLTARHARLAVGAASTQTIKQAVRAPIQNRRPVGDQRAFLNDYRPNETHYLPAETRQRLLEMGRPPDGERPAGTYARTILVAELVAAVVRAGMDKKAATALSRQREAEQVPPPDQARFVEVVETEITSLHEGNIARYRLRPAEYRAWRQGWR